MSNLFTELIQVGNQLIKSDPKNKDKLVSQDILGQIKNGFLLH